MTVQSGSSYNQLLQMAETSSEVRFSWWWRVKSWSGLWYYV